jgi:hypothetical protein
VQLSPDPSSIRRAEALAVARRTSPAGSEGSYEGSGCELCGEQAGRVEVNADRTGQSIGYLDFSVLSEFAGKWGSETFWVYDPASGRFAQNALTRELGSVANFGADILKG